MCSPELSDFETAIWQSFPQDSVLVLGITSVNQNQINQFVTETGITYPILQDESTGGGFGGVTYDEYYIPNQGSPYPRDFIVDQNGILVYANNEVDTEYMIYILDELLSEEDLGTDDYGFIPSRYELFPSFPNPFNPTTTIPFNIPVETRFITSLRIFDITARVVETLLNEKLIAGEHEVVWDASGFSSGIYFLRLQSGSNFQTQKLILLK